MNKKFGIMKRVLVSCTFSLLICLAFGKQKKLKSDIASRRFSLPLGVPRGTTSDVVADFEALAAFAATEKLGDPTTVMLRMSLLKLRKALQEEKRGEERAAAKLKKNAAAKLTNEANQKVASAAQFAPEFTTPPLRKTTDAAVCNVARYSPAELAAKMSSASFNLATLLSAPFIVRTEIGSGGRGADEDPLVHRLRTAWTAEILERDNADVRVRYFNPVLAKEQRAQGALSGTVEEAQEQFVPENIKFETFFRYCYGSSKRPGTETEHCEQVSEREKDCRREKESWE